MGPQLAVMYAAALAAGARPHPQLAARVSPTTLKRLPPPGPDFELITIPGLNGSGLQWCGGGRLCAVLTALGRRFELVLQRHDLFAQGALGVETWAQPTNTTAVRAERWLSGVLAGDPRSAVRMNVVPDGRFHGAIHTGNDGVYIVELGDTAGAMAVYHERAVPKLARPRGHRCASTRFQRDVSPEPPDTSAPGHRGRRGPAGSVCRVFLDADESFFEYWGGPPTDPAAERMARATLKMIEIIYQVDGLYSREYNVQSLLSLKVAGAKVHRGVRFVGNDGSAVLREYQNWLTTSDSEGDGRMLPRGPALLGPDDVCLNHLFTHAPAGGVLGVAIQAYPGKREGGICSKAGKAGVATNVGFTNTMGEDGNVVPIWQSVLSTAHEFGHNVGAVHDCVLSNAPRAASHLTGEETSQLCPLATGTRCLPEEVYGGAFLMFPAIGTDVSGPNSRVFSPCSIEKIGAVIEAKGGCLDEPSPCAAVDETCCNEHFTVVDGTRCSMAAPTLGVPGGGSSGGQWIGRCKSGICAGPHDDFCASLAPSADSDSPADIYVGCTISGSECLRTCAILGDPASCAFRSTTQQPSRGSLCTTSDGLDGVCTDDGSCQPCNRLDCPEVGASCQYTEGLLTPCSQPCGGGTMVQSYRCDCDMGCTDLPPPFRVLECRQNACTSSGVRTVEVDLLGANPDELDVTAFEEAGRQVLEFPVTVTAIIEPHGVANATQCMVVVEACRNYKESIHCVSAAELRNAFIRSEARWSEVDPPLGYTVVVRAKPSLSSGSRRLEPWEIVLVGVGLLLFGLLGGVLVMIARRQANRRSALPESEGELPGPRLRLGSEVDGKTSAEESNRAPAVTSTVNVHVDAGSDSIAVLPVRSLATAKRVRVQVL